MQRDITEDFLLCNRCGACRAVCPVCDVVRDELASARGKVELAEAFFRGEKVDEKEIQRIFDLCLHCMACEANCPSGMRADEIIMAVRAETAKRGLIPRSKRLAIRMLGSMDNILFKTMRLFRLTRKKPLHGTGARSPLSAFYPLFGWPRQRFLPMPAGKPFLGNHPEYYPADFYSGKIPDPSNILENINREEGFSPEVATELVRRIMTARQRNLEKKSSTYYFIGHTVNHFFPEESESLIFVLNLLGIDVHIPADQACCGAPVYYAGDIEGARKAAAKLIERFEGHEYKWITTSCSSGGLMLKNVFPRLLDLSVDSYFDIVYDPEEEVFRRKDNGAGVKEKYREIGELYKKHIEGKVLDINELVASELGFRKVDKGFESLLGDEAGAEEAIASVSGSPQTEEDFRPVVTYHHPCHLIRGQEVDWQPEAILEHLPGWRYMQMKDADKCCGGGGTFTLVHPSESEEIASRKIDAIEEVSPAVVSTSCPVCRIQLIDMLRRRYELEAADRGEEMYRMPVLTPLELLAGDLAMILQADH